MFPDRAVAARRRETSEVSENLGCPPLVLPEQRQVPPQTGLRLIMLVLLLFVHLDNENDI